MNALSNTRTARTRKTRHSRPFESNTPSLPHRREAEAYVNEVYAVGGTSQLPQSFDPPASPPPPYEEFENEYTHAAPMPATAFHPQPVQSQHCAPTSRDNRLRRKASAWASTIDLSKQVTARPYVQEQGWQSSVNLAAAPTRSPMNECPVVSTMVQSAALCDRAAAVIHEALHEALSRLDREADGQDDLVEATRGMALEEHPLERTRGGASIIDFKKTWMYSNSRLPPYVAPVKIYLPTWQLICSAAQASMDVYQRPRKDAKQDYVEADWRQGTKAMIVNSRPVDDKNLIVIAIRGSKWNIVDWAVNFRPAPTEPIGFLDDEGNACHAGFLQVARAMISPIAARLRNLLEQDPSRTSSSLLFSGHSAGGAVASLLYMHMTASAVESDLNILTGCFKRVHCITFGTPPLSFLPLQNPAGKRYERNVFMSFANEGDPVVRADRQYLSTLARIVAAPSPMSSSNGLQGIRHRVSRHVAQNGADRTMPVRWSVPPATLSNAGRMVLLREKPGRHRSGNVEAVGVTDEELREVIFGDPEMHHMDMYSRRIHDLAFAAITGRGG